MRPLELACPPTFATPSEIPVVGRARLLGSASTPGIARFGEACGGVSTVRSANNSSIASRASPMSRNLRLASFSTHRLTSRRTPAGITLKSGSVFSTPANVSDTVDPANGSVAVSISYSTTQVTRGREIVAGARKTPRCSRIVSNLARVRLQPRKPAGAALAVAVELNSFQAYGSQL
jgi:hypothetical protein